MIRPMDVLVVDDEQDTCEMMTILLEALGHQVALAANGNDALVRLLVERERFDVVLMDVQMPGMDGLEAVRRLRANDATRELPILCVSAKADGRTKEEGLQAGCDVYLTKPIHEDRIFEAITALMHRKGTLAPDEAFS